MPVGVGRIFESVCLCARLFVCLFACPKHNSKTNDSKVFKLRVVQNDLDGIPQKWYCFGVQRSKVKITGSVSSFRILEPCIPEPRFIDIR